MTKNELIKFGDNIKRLRKKIGLSQDELAELCGYTSRSSIAKIESGCVDIPQSKIVVFAKALKVLPTDLLSEKTVTDDLSIPDYYYDKEIRELIDFLHKNPDYKVLFDASRKIKPEDIDFVRKMIDKMGGNDE